MLSTLKIIKLDWLSEDEETAGLAFSVILGCIRPHKYRFLGLSKETFPQHMLSDISIKVNKVWIENK